MLNTLATELAAISSFVFGAALFAVQALAFEGGRWWGGRRIGNEGTLEGNGIVVAGMLGLLGFVLALTLAHASTRFEERRQGTLAEANAIGTAWLRARSVDHAKGGEIAAQLQDYASLRLAFARAGANATEVAEINQRTARLQSDIWQNLAAVTRDRTDPIAALLVEALNETFDRTTAERFAFALAIPSQMLWLITGLPVAAMAALGFHLGQRQDSQRALPLILIAMLSSVSTFVLDLGTPRVGNIRPSVAAYEWTISGFRGSPPDAARPAGR